MMMTNREFAQYLIDALKENRQQDPPADAVDVIEHYLNLYHEAIVVDLMRVGGREEE